MKRVFAILTSVLMASCLYAQETGEHHVSKELLIIGTMHEVSSTLVDIFHRFRKENGERLCLGDEHIIRYIEYATVINKNSRIYRFRYP